MSVSAKIHSVNFRAVPCLGSGDPCTLEPQTESWTHVKVQIIDFTAVETKWAKGEPIEKVVKVSNAGSSMTNASLRLTGASVGDFTVLKLEPAERLGARVAEVLFEKGVTSFPVEAILSATYKSPQDGEERQMQATFKIKDPLKKAGSCCVIA